MTPYRGKNYDPMYHIKKGFSKPATRDAAVPAQPRRKFIPPAEPIPARIIIVATGEVYDTYPSRSAANKVLQDLIKDLPKGAPHTYEIEDDI